MTTQPAGATVSYTHTPQPAIQEQIDLNNALRLENATLRATLIDVTRLRDQAQRQAAALQQELDRALLERVS
jgi:hypothetical protein